MTTSSSRVSGTTILLIVNYLLFTAPFFFIPLLYIFIGQFNGWGESAAWKAMAVADLVLIVSAAFSLFCTVVLILGKASVRGIVAMVVPFVLIAGGWLFNFIWMLQRQ